MLTKTIKAICLSLIIAFLAIDLTAGELVQLYPQNSGNYSKRSLPTDELYEFSYIDSVAEFYFGSGSVDDTFFVVFKPLAACSVFSCEVQWYNAGNVTSFTADYSDSARIYWPLGCAPPPGSTDLSPIGEMYSGFYPNNTIGNMDWEELEIGDELIIGDSLTGEPDLFGIGFIKDGVYPHPLVDNVAARGINQTHSWFGGPWMSSYEHDWGGCCISMNSIPVEIMMRIWVSYPWGIPILILDFSQQCNTYNTSGPFVVTCELIDDNGIGVDDTLELIFTVNEGPENHVELVDIEPVGDDIYGGEIEGNFNVGDIIHYWIYTVDDQGLINSTEGTKKFFQILEPENQNAELLYIEDNIDWKRSNAYTEVFDELGIEYETWDAEYHRGIDESVVNWGWNKIFLVGFNTSTLSPGDELTVYSDFLDDGGNLAVIDEEIFFTDLLPPWSNFEPGQFGYDYLGITDFNIDPAEIDTVYFGCESNPIGDDFVNDPIITYFDSNPELGYEFMLPDNITDMNAEPVFYDTISGNYYGCNYENDGFRTVTLTFMAEASCTTNEFGTFLPSNQFRMLIGNILEWFGYLKTDDGNRFNLPVRFELKPPHPNPFNQSVALDFALPAAAPVKLIVYDIQGREVVKLVDEIKPAGSYEVVFDASELSSGIFFANLSAGGINRTEKLILIK